MLKAATEIRKRSTAELAGIRFVSSVRSHVSAQFEVDNKCFAANTKFDRSKKYVIILVKKYN